MNKKIIVVLSFVLLLLVVSGCSKAPSEVPADNNQEQLDIADENPEQVQAELEDPSLDELDNIDLSDW